MEEWRVKWVSVILKYKIIIPEIKLQYELIHKIELNW